MDLYRYISVVAYLVGLLFWFVIWKAIVGYHWLKKEPLMHVPFWGACFVLLLNMFLAFISDIPTYQVEIGIYSFVETNGITVAGFAMAIAVFVVITFKGSINVLKHKESSKFLQLIFTSFLVVVLGVIPLYWIPQVDGWLTVLRNLKTIPFTYSLFILASAIVIYLHILKEDLKEKIDSQELK